MASRCNLRGVDRTALTGPNKEMPTDKENK